MNPYSAKALGIILLVFAVGFVSGVTVTRYLPSAGPENDDSPDRGPHLPHFLKRKLTNGLDLTPVQHKRIDAELESMGKQLESAKEEFKPLVKKIVDSTYAAIQKELTQEQWKRFQENEERLRRWLSHKKDKHRRHDDDDDHHGPPHRDGRDHDDWDHRDRNEHDDRHDRDRDKREHHKDDKDHKDDKGDKGEVPKPPAPERDKPLLDEDKDGNASNNGLGLGPADLWHRAIVTDPPQRSPGSGKAMLAWELGNHPLYLAHAEPCPPRDRESKGDRCRP